MPRLVFDFPDPDADGEVRRRIFDHPVDVLQASSPAEVIPALARAEAAARAGCWVAGFVSYEAAPAFDAAMQTHAPGRLPLLWLGVFEAARDDPAPRTAPPSIAPPPAAPPPAAPLHWTSDTSREAYDVAFARIREALLAGESYQVNYTTRLHATLPAGFDADAAYAALRRAQGSGWHADIDLGDVRILSASPELFFARRGRTIVTRPMKGTHRRGRWLEEDDDFARALVTSPKERAENLMIVDLLRNDIGRIARTGTVRVPSLFAVERYPTVLQMTSTITAELHDACGVVDIFRALFPCGSVTGAPKIQTMKLIRALEDAPREVYCGAIGMIEPGGDCTFSVPIRTMWVDHARGVVEYGVGSAITVDATPAREAAELRAKAAILSVVRPEFSLIETMRFDAGHIIRLERHLARLAQSCAYFGWNFPEDAVRERLRALCTHHGGRRRVRLALDARGTLAVDVAPLDDEECGSDTIAGTFAVAEPATDGECVIIGWREPMATRALMATVEPTTTRAHEPRRVAIAPHTVDSTAALTYHKTTLRAAFERARATAVDCFDVILGNEHGEATELTRGNLVVLLDGELVTPPRSAGLLAGCLRQELLELGIVRERSIRLDDLHRAGRLWFVNSLRGAIAVRLDEAKMVNV